MQFTPGELYPHRAAGVVTIPAGANIIIRDGTVVLPPGTRIVLGPGGTLLVEAERCACERCHDRWLPDRLPGTRHAGVTTAPTETVVWLESSARHGREAS